MAKLKEIREWAELLDLYFQELVKRGFTQEQAVNLLCAAFKARSE